MISSKIQSEKDSFLANGKYKPKISSHLLWFLKSENSCLDALSQEDAKSWFAFGERIKDGLIVKSEDNNDIYLHKGGILLNRSDGKIIAVQPDLFRKIFSRCFSTGAEIIRLNESPKNQAIALAKANTQLRNRHNEIMNISYFKSILQRKKIRSQKINLAKWDMEIDRHIEDLRSDTFNQLDCDRLK